MITADMRAEMRRLVFVERWKIDTVARRFGVHHATVRRALSDDPPGETHAGKSGLDAFKPYVIQRLTELPELTAVRLFSEIQERGYRVVTHLQFLPVTVKTNPFPDLFDFLSPESPAPAWQADFPPQVPGLAVDDINLIGMSVNNKLNAGESNSQIIGNACDPAPAQNDDDDHCDDLGSPPNAFTNAINSALAGAGRSDLDFHNALDRANAMTCAGCHQIQSGQPLGGGNGHPALTWPQVRLFGFVHINERGDLSPALWCEFLPFRKRNLDRFFSSPIQPCPVVDDPNQLQPSTGDTISGKPEGATN